MYPENLKYSKEHEWVQVVEGNKVKIGLTHFAQDAMGDVVFVELPEESDEFDAGESFATVESVKAVSDCYLPVSGSIVSVNESLFDSPELINTSPYEEGFLVELEVSDLGEVEALMSSEEYQKFLEEED